MHYDKNTDWEQRKHRRWRIECDEEKLRLLADLVEDMTRFLCGQPQLMNSLMMFRNGRLVGEAMETHIKPMLNPELTPGESYGWNGGRCPNEAQRKTIAQGYCAYKSILAALANEYDWRNVHSGTMLTCDEGGAQMLVSPVMEETDERELWTAADPDGKQYVYRSKPVRRKWANGDGWEPSEGGSWYNEDFSKFMIDALGLPTLTWEDEPFRFRVTTEKREKR